MIAFGLGVAGLGLALLVIGRVFPSFRPGRLPGDVVWERPGMTVAIPITSMLLLSGFLTLMFWLVNHWR